MSKKECKKCFVIIVIIGLRVVDDDGKENYHTADKAKQKSFPQFVYPGFFMNVGIATCDFIEQHPGKREQCKANPEFCMHNNLSVCNKHFIQQVSSCKKQHHPRQDCCEIVCRSIGI